jgi:hypothetical protein
VRAAVFALLGAVAVAATAAQGTREPTILNLPLGP